MRRQAELCGARSVHGERKCSRVCALPVVDGALNKDADLSSLSLFFLFFARLLCLMLFLMCRGEGQPCKELPVSVSCFVCCTAVLTPAFRIVLVLFQVLFFFLVKWRLSHSHLVALKNRKTKKGTSYLYSDEKVKIHIHFACSIMVSCAYL